MLRMDETYTIYLLTNLQNGKKALIASCKPLPSPYPKEPFFGMRGRLPILLLLDIKKMRRGNPDWHTNFRFEALKSCKERYIKEVITDYVKRNELWDERGYHRRRKDHPERILATIRKEKRVKREYSRREKIRKERTGKHTSRLHRYKTSMGMRLCRRSESEKEHVRLTMQEKGDTMYKVLNKENYKLVCRLRNKGWSYDRIHIETLIPYVSVARYIRRGMDTGKIKIAGLKERTKFHL
jgi:hypothetical protein